MQSVGKNFERQLLRSFRCQYPRAWSHKHTDALYNTAMSAPSPPDLIVVAETFNMLVECKAVKGTSIPFNRLAEHQEEHLRAFNDTRHDSYGAIAILRYNGLRGGSRIFHSWLIPIDEWVSLRSSVNRKSLPLADVQMLRHLEQYYMHWNPSTGFHLLGAVQAITGASGK